SFAQSGFTVATLDRHEYLPTMVARSGWLEFRCLSCRSVSVIEFSLDKKKAREAAPCLISKRIAVDRLSCQFLSFIELPEVNHQSRQEIIRSGVPRCELLRATHFVHTLSKFPFDKKANPAKRGVCLRELRLDRHGPRAVTCCFRPCVF